MKKSFVFYFAALSIVMASCTKDEIADPSMVTEKAGHARGPVIYLSPSGGDDTQMFIDAFAASTPGTTIQMSAGVFHVGYIEVYGFNGILKGAGRDKTFIVPAELFEVNPVIEANLLPTWWKIIAGDVTLSDFAFRTGDGPLISDEDPMYIKVMSCLLMVNNYNVDYNLTNPVPMNFTMRCVDFLCGNLDPAQAYLGLPYNTLMPFWVGSDAYWPDPTNTPELTSGNYNIINCSVKNAFQGFEGFGLGENAVFNLTGCKTEECPWGITFIACYGSKASILNNSFINTLFGGVWVTDMDWNLLSYMEPVKGCEYVITGNTFYPLSGSTGLKMNDEWGIVHPEKYFPLQVTAKNNLFNLTEGSIGVSCLNSVGATVRNNRFTGTCDMGVFVNGVDVFDAWTGEYIGTGEAKNVLILGNNFTGLTATEADIVLGELSSGCTVVGNGNDVEDLGTNNKIVGMNKVHGGNHTGPMIRDNLRMMPHLRGPHH